MRSTAAALATSTSMAIASALLREASAATASALAARLSATARRAPSWANSSALARPMPEPPPVMMQTLPLSRMFGTSGVLDPAKNMARDRHDIAVLIHRPDVGERLALLRIDLGDRVGERDGVADEDRPEKPHLVVAERDRRLVARGAPALVDHQGRAGRHVADDQRAVGDAAAVFRARHVLLVDVIDRKIPGDPREQVDVGFPDGLCEADVVTDFYIEILHCRYAPDPIPF